MRKENTYEWTLEVINSDGDIEQSLFEPTLQDIGRYSDFGGRMGRELMVALVKSTGNEYDGIVDRTWAYIEDGSLNERFQDGTKVPKKFMREFEKSTLTFHDGGQIASEMNLAGEYNVL